MNIKYTWYVNLMGDVQVYEGDVNESLIFEVYSLEDAMKDVSEHTIVVGYKHVGRGLFGLRKAIAPTPIIEKRYENKMACKYWIPQEFAHAFFTCINENPRQTAGNSGCTDIDVSEWLD